MSDKYAPLPWTIHQTQDSHRVGLLGSDGLLAGATYRKADAEFIVRACNTHADLVKALRIAAELLARNGIERPEITAALARVDGEEVTR